MMLYSVVVVFYCCVLLLYSVLCVCVCVACCLQTIDALKREISVLKQTISTLQSNNLCRLCHTANRTVVLLPCKHLLLCSACAAKEQKRSVPRCPQCDSPFSELLDGIQVL
jgi:hypothetical protein